MFTVVIPTIWSPPIDFIDKNIESLSNNDLVKNIILINNKLAFKKHLQVLLQAINLLNLFFIILF